MFSQSFAKIYRYYTACCQRYAIACATPLEISTVFPDPAAARRERNGAFTNLSVVRLSTCCFSFHRTATARPSSLADHAWPCMAWVGSIPTPHAPGGWRTSASLAEISRDRLRGAVHEPPPWATSTAPGGAWRYCPLPVVIHRSGRSAIASVCRISSVVNDALRHTQATHNDQGALPAQCRRRPLVQRQ